MTVSAEFTAAGITKIAIVDDDFDYPSVSDLPQAFTDLLTDATDEDFPPLRAFAQTIGLIDAEAAKTQASVIAALGSAAFLPAFLNSEDAAVAALRQKYLATLIQEKEKRRKPLKAIIDHLKATGCTDESIETFGRQVQADQLSEASLIFVDLMLDNTRTSQQSVALIVAVVGEARTASRHVPSIVLMSQNADQLDQVASTVRKAARIPGTAFRFVTKGDLEQSHGTVRLGLLVKQVMSQRPLTGAVYQFIDTWGRVIRDSSANFENRLWNLDVRSIHGLLEAAEKDGANQDDHIADFLMRSVLWGIEEHREAKETLTKLAGVLASKDQSTAEQVFLPDPFDRGRSIRELAQHYQWHAPQWIVQQPAGQLHACDWVRKHLSFGDVFLANDYPRNFRVFVHLTQPCDLTRICPNDPRPLLFVPGAIGAPGRSRGSRYNLQKVEVTRDFQFGGKWFDFSWDLEQARTFTPAEAATALYPVDSAKYKLVGRMRPDVALGLLNKYASRLTRLAYSRATWMTAVSLRAFSRANNGAAWQPLAAAGGAPRDFSGTITEIRNNVGLKLTVSEWEVAELALLIAGQSRPEDVASSIMAGIEAPARGGKKPIQCVGGRVELIFHSGTQADLDKSLQNAKGTLALIAFEDESRLQ